MPDSGNDSKNPWGKGPGGRRNPWGDPQNDGPDPDMDDAIKRMQEGLKDFLPSDMDNGRWVIIGLVALTVLWLASGLYIVQPGEHAVIQRFGKWSRTQAEEGLGYHMPVPIETATKVNVSEIQRMNIGFFDRSARDAGARQDIPDESLMLTSDRNIVDLDLVIQWDVKSAEQFLFSVRDQENTIKRVAESAIREAVGQTPMFQIITTKRDEVAQRAREILQQNLDQYNSGVNITQVLVQKAEVHPDVQDAFQDVQSAKQDAEDVQNRAQAYREDILPKARGEAIRMKQEAEGYKQSAVAKATGDAERFNSVLSAYQSGQDVTKERMYIETMEQVLMNAQKIIMDGNSSQGVVPYLPLNEMKRSQSTDTPSAVQ